MFYSIQYENGCLAASDLRHKLTKSINFYTFHYHVSRTESTDILKNVIHQIDIKNECLLLSASFTAKFGLDFVLTLENTF